MEEASLPLSYHCRNARLYLKKAAFCKKSTLFSDELSHLRKFETLVASTIPAHPLFSISSKEKQVFELLDCLPDCRRRIHELETEQTHIPCAYKTPPRSPVTVPRKGKMSSNSRGIPSDSPASLASRRASGAGDSPSKKQQSWGIWTANPQHDPSQLGSNSPVGAGGLSPPSSRKRAILKGKKPASAAAKKPIVVPALPLRSSSPDQRLQAMIGGCALVVNQLQPSGDKKYDAGRRAATEAESSMAPENKPRSANLQMGGTSKNPSELLFAPPKGAHYLKAQKERAMTPPLYADQDQKSPERAAQRFRFASQFLENRLKDRMDHIQRQFPDTDEDGSASSPTKMRMSLDRLTGDTVLQEGEGSSAEESAGHGASSSTLEIFSKHLNHGTDPAAVTGRLQRMALADQEDIISTERSQVLSSTDDTWARKLVPIVEQKLCHDMLHPRSASQKPTPRSNRKRNRKRGILGVMDDVIRRAVDSDSALSNATSPRFLASGQDDSPEIKKRNDGTSEQKKLQSEELEAKFTSLQDLVGELRRCMEGFTARVEEEGERWQSEMQGLEKNLCLWREDTENQLMGMKKGLRDEMHKMMDEVRIGLIRVERLLEDVESSKEKQEFTKQTMEDCTNGMDDSMQKKLESLVASMKADLLLELKEKLTSGIRRDLDVFELAISKQFEGMQKEMETALAESEELHRSEKKHIDAILDEKMEKRFSQRMEIVSGGKEKVIADMKNELRLLWIEVDMLSKGREEMKDTVDQLAHIAKEAKQSIDEEQNVLKSENGMLKKQLQYFKKESMQVRADTDDFKKEIELEMEDIRSSLERMKEEGKSMKSVVENVLESEAIRRNKGEESSEGAHERMLIMEKVEGISQLYLGGLEDVRSELLSFKLECQDRMDELEAYSADLSRCQQEQQEKAGASDAQQLPLGELVLDGLESRVSHLEGRLEQNGSLEDERLKTLAAMEKDREQTSAALDHVASAAQKADEFISEMVNSFSSELAAVMRQSHKIQESLATERDTARVSAAEVKKMSEDMEREMQIAMIVISEAKTKGLKIQEGIEKEISVLKGSIVLDKEAAALAATNASDAAAKAEAALMAIHKMQSESFAISEDMAEATSHAYMNYSKELESHLEEWRNRMHAEVTRAQTLIEGIEEEKQRIQGSADCVEKPVSEKDFEQHLKKTEDVFAELERSVREIRATMEAESAARLTEVEQKDATTRHEIKDLKEKVEEAITRLEEASGCNNNDVSAKLHTVDDLMQDMKSLESKISETVSAQVETAEKVTECFKKVRKLESMQLNTASSVEEVHASTGDLQKSASMWLQKYDAAARLLQDLEKRTLTLENSFSRGGGGGEHPKDKLDHVDLTDNMQPAQKERLINLYGELSGFVQRMKANDGGHEDDGKDGNGWTPLDTRLVSLENRVAQVETETLSNLRVLDAKMEDFSVGVQTALEGASMAESKCSALGGELVKLFRMIATTRKESPSKMMMMMDVTAGVDELNNEQQHTQQQHHHHQQQQQQPPSRSGRSVAVKGKGQTACNFCKKAATKGNSGDNSVEGGRGDGGHNHAGLPETYPSTTDGNRMNNFYSNEAGDVEQRSPEGFERSLKACDVHGKQSPQYHGISRDVSPTFKITKQQLQKDKDDPTSLESMWKRATSEGRLFEGKLPITLDERRVDTAKKLEGVQISTGKPELQLTNIRLEAGKVHVNVSHRPPSSLMGMRGMKRGDAMSAAQP